MKIGGLGHKDMFAVLWTNDLEMTVTAANGIID
jgi:hypothetical protein